MQHSYASPERLILAFLSVCLKDNPILFAVFKSSIPMMLDKRIQILEATADLIAEQGLHCCPMAKIAKHAKVGAGTIYRYFETKEVLIQHLHLYICQKLADFCTHDYPKQASIRDRLSHVWGKFYSFMLENPREQALLDQMWANPALSESAHQEAMTEINMLTLNLLDEAKKTRAIKSLPNQVLLTYTFGSLFNIATRQQQSPALFTEPIELSSLIELCWDAIKI